MLGLLGARIKARRWGWQQECGVRKVQVQGTVRLEQGIRGWAGLGWAGLGLAGLPPRQ